MKQLDVDVSPPGFVWNSNFTLDPSLLAFRGKFGDPNQDRIPEI